MFKKVLFVALFMFASLGQAIEDKINVNTADAVSIAKALDGVGLKKAEAIVAYREKHGEFTSLQALVKVKGIGDSLLSKNMEKMTIE